MSLKKLDDIGIALLLLFAMMFAFGCAMVLAGRAAEVAAEPTEENNTAVSQTTEFVIPPTFDGENYEPTLDELISTSKWFWVYGPILHLVHKIS